MTPTRKLWFVLFCILALLSVAAGGAVLAIVFLAFALFLILTSRANARGASPSHGPRGLVTFDRAGEWIDGFLCGFADRLHLDRKLLPLHQSAVLGSNPETARAFAVSYHSAHPEAFAEEAALQYTRLVLGDVAGIEDQKTLIAIPRGELRGRGADDPSDSGPVLVASRNSTTENDLLGISLDPSEYHASIPVSLAVTCHGGQYDPASRLETYIRRECGAIRDVAVLCSDEQDLHLSLVGAFRQGLYAVSMLVTLRLDRLSPEVLILDHVEICGADLGRIAVEVVNRLRSTALSGIQRH